MELKEGTGAFLDFSDVRVGTLIQLEWRGQTFERGFVVHVGSDGPQGRRQVKLFWTIGSPHAHGITTLVEDGRGWCELDVAQSRNGTIVFRSKVHYQIALAPKSEVDFAL